MTDEEMSQLTDEMIDKEIERCNLEIKRLERCIRNIDIALYVMLVLFVFSLFGAMLFGS